MKRLVLGGLILGLAPSTLAVPAWADPTVNVSAPVARAIPGALRAQRGTVTVPDVMITGRPNKPMVAIVVRRPTAADAAGAAHEQLRVATVAKSEPGVGKTN